MEFKQHDLTAAQNDYAIFLPAVSSFYSTYIGRQRHEQYVESTRMPAAMPDMESMNFLNDQKGLFPYKWCLYSAGHADLDVKKFNPKEDMIRNRGKHTTVIADSGGFQIAKGVWPGKWAAANDKAAEKKRAAVLEWQCTIADYGMTMDIPTWTYLNPEWAAKAGIASYEDAVLATSYNNDYWLANRFGDTKILNVLQGSNHAEADYWYEAFKSYSDPNKHARHFNGWGMGGQNMCDVHLILKRLVTLIHDGLLEKGVHDWMHFLGTSKLEWAVLLTTIQRAIRQYHNSNFTISFDCASPFLATANGQLYHTITTEDRGKWSYQMSPTADNKKFSIDSRSFRDAVMQEKIHMQFEDSPISARLKISDVCYYKPGDLNKIGKEGRTSWDSFSYALLMGHNVWMHIEAVQRANREFDAGRIPAMLVDERFDIVTVESVINKVFAQKDKTKSLSIIDHYSRLWDQIIGTRGFTGKRTTNAQTTFNALFDVDETIDEDELDESKLDELEQNI